MVSCGTMDKTSTYVPPSTGCVEGNCINGTGTYKYPDGNIYKGEWERAQNNGHGIYKFSNGDIYEGLFYHDSFSGKGKYTYADGTVEEGIFDSYFFNGLIKLPKTGDNKKIQVSKVIEVKPSSFEVTVAVSDAGGLKMGDKLFIEINNTICALDVNFPMMTVARCKMIGGTRTLINQVKKDMPVYRMVKGIKRGNNIFLFPNGNKYIGDYKGELMHGKGEFIWTNGNKYNGEFKNGMRHGNGTLTYFDGGIYSGGWKNGYRCGHGKQKFGDGDFYDGEYGNDGRKTGNGTYIWANGYKYVGEWKNTNMHGKGTMTYPDGRKYIGEWENSKYNGKGTLYASDGSIISQGQWVNDVFKGN